MREYQEKQKIRRRLYSKTSIIIVFVVMILVARGVMGVYATEKSSRMEVDRLSKQKNEIEGRLKVVSKNNDMLATSQGIEYEIRNKFDVAKEGEGVIVIVDKELPPAVEEEQGMLKKFWGSMTGVFKNEDDEGKKAEEEKPTEENTDSDGQGGDND